MITRARRDGDATRNGDRFSGQGWQTDAGNTGNISNQRRLPVRPASRGDVHKKTGGRKKRNIRSHPFPRRALPVFVCVMRPGSRRAVSITLS